MNDPSRILRILDANLDRAGEGLRVLEDVARLSLCHAALAERLRSTRHGLAQAVQRIPGLPERLVAARDSASDVGRAASHARPHRSLLDLVETNFDRVQEAVRCLEEFSRCLSTDLAQVFGQLRFEVYDIEHDLLPLVERASVAQRLEFELYVVVTGEFCGGREVTDVIRAAIDGGARAVQLREKSLGGRDLFALACAVRQRIAPGEALYIVNDALDVALACGADGVHLGQDDLPICAARALAGPGFVIGASTHSVAQAEAALAQGASYVNCGPVYPTRTKTQAHPPVGLALVREFAALHRRTPGGIVFTTMGGINRQNVADVVEAGADRVAVVTAVVSADDVRLAAQELLTAIRQARQRRTQAQEPL